MPLFVRGMQVPKKMSAQHGDLVRGIDTVKEMVGRLDGETNVVQMLQQIKVRRYENHDMIYHNDVLFDHSRFLDCSMHAERPSSH